MTLLLDTHAFLWFVLNDPAISATARQALEDGENDLCVSPASYWEIAIKISRGNYRLNSPYEAFWRTGIDANEIEIVPIELRHTSRLIALPHHHKDPFDRLLVAQALEDDLTLVSGDATLDAYGVQRLWERAGRRCRDDDDDGLGSRPRSPSSARSCSSASPSAGSPGRGGRRRSPA